MNSNNPYKPPLKDSAFISNKPQRPRVPKYKEPIVDWQGLFFVLVIGGITAIGAGLFAYITSSF